MVSLRKFAGLFGVPEFAISHLQHFFSQGDIELVTALDGGKATAQQVAEKMQFSQEKVLAVLEDCWDRYVVNRVEENGEYLYLARNFYENLMEYRCLLDSYRQLDENLRKQLADWCYQYFLDLRKPLIPKILNHEPLGGYVLKRFLPYEEIDSFLDSCKKIGLLPCNCRSLAGNCDKPRGTCLRFNDHAKGRTAVTRMISRKEAKEIIQAAHAAGLMQSVNGDWKTRGPQWMCNCDACCCWPTRFGIDTGLKAILYQDHHVARHDPRLCVACGKCTARCNFKAFHRGERDVVIKGKKRKEVLFDPRRCWGCGICLTTCPTKAISLKKVE
jgi:NAD-dependent dihydropyrimidine dehydrogenase PreA subunit